MKALKLLEPKPQKAFRDKYLAVMMMVAALLISSVVSAQLDSARYSLINGYGFKYKRMAFDSVLMVPRSTSPHVPWRAGAIRYNAPDSTLQLWTGSQWNSILTGIGNGVDTAYVINDTVLAIETPDEDYLLIIPGRPRVDSIYRKSGQDSIFYLKNGVEYAVKDSTGGSGSAALSNVGTGFRWVAAPNGSIKSAIYGYGLNGDSTTTANTITVQADTSELVTPSDLAAADRLGAKVFYLTKSGGVSDADITMHSSSDGTNNTTAIKTILDQASSTQAIELIIDGKFSADSLRIKSNTTITILKGCGLIQRSGVNCSFIANYNRTASTVIDSNIVIRGGTINGHGHNADGSENRTYNGGKGWNTILNFRGIKNLTISDCEIINSRTFLSFISNCENVIVQNCTGLQSPAIPMASPPDVSYSLIHDGFKFNGPARNVNCLNNTIYSVDDAISVCSNDGFFPTPETCFGLNLLDSFVSYGNIIDFTINGLTFKNGYHGLRVLTSADTIENLSINNLRGTVNENICNIDNFPGSCIYNHGASYVDGYIKNISFNNIDVNVIRNTTDNSTGSAGIYVSTFINNMSLNKFQYSGYQSGYPLFKLNSGKTIDNLYANGVVIQEVQPPATAFTLSGTATNTRGDVFDNHESHVTVFNNYNVVLKKSGTDRDLMLNNNSQANSLANLTLYPNSGTNIASSLSIMPKGTGQSGNKSQFDFFNTDFKADQTNVEEMLWRATGSDGYGIISLAAGTGSRRNIWFDMTGSIDKNQASLTLATNSQIGINNPSPTHKLDIVNTGNGSTGWGMRITGSSSSGPGMVLKNNDNSKNWLITSGQTTATDGTFLIYDLEQSKSRFYINPSTGAITFNDGSDSYAFPTTRPTTGQYLGYSSAGVLSWSTPPTGTTYTFTNGLTNASGTVKIGGTQTEDITISTAGFTTAWTGSNDNETLFSVSNSGSTSASAISGTASGTTSTGVAGTSSSYIGVYGNSTSNTGVQGQSSSGVGVIGVSSTGAGVRSQINPSSNNAIENVVTALRTSSSGAGANGLGAAIQYELETATNGNSQIAGSLAFKWSDATAATRTSDFEVYTVNSGSSARKFAIGGDGKITADGYGAGTHTVTPATTPVYSSAGVIGERVAPKIYTALLSQSGTGNPTATVLGTNEIGTIVWTRNSAGNYTGTLTGAFTNNKTWLICQKGDGNGSFVNALLSRFSADALSLDVRDNANSVTDNFTNMAIEIRVYP